MARGDEVRGDEGRVAEQLAGRRELDEGEFFPGGVVARGEGRGVRDVGVAEAELEFGAEHGEAVGLRGAIAGVEGEEGGGGRHCGGGGVKFNRYLVPGKDGNVLERI